MKALIEKLSRNEFYKKWFKDALPYVTGALLLSLFQVVTFATTGNPWGVSGVLANWGAWIFKAVGGSVDNWYYFSSPGAQATLSAGVLSYADGWRNIGIIVGALFASLLASGFKIKKIKSIRQVIAAALGGVLMATAQGLPPDATLARSTAASRRFRSPVGCSPVPLCGGGCGEQAACEFFM